MRKLLVRLAIAVGLLSASVAVQVAVDPKPAGALYVLESDRQIVQGQHHTYRVDTDYLNNGDTELKVTRCEYNNPYNCNWGSLEVYARVQSFACFKVIGGGAGIGPARLMILDNWDNYGQSCNFPSIWAQCGIPNVVATTSNAQFMAWTGQTPCPYNHYSGYLAYGYYAPLDTNWDPRLANSNYHYWFLI